MQGARRVGGVGNSRHGSLVIPAVDDKIVRRRIGGQVAGINDAVVRHINQIQFEKARPCGNARDIKRAELGSIGAAQDFHFQAADGGGAADQKDMVRLWIVRETAFSAARSYVSGSSRSDIPDLLEDIGGKELPRIGSPA